METEVSLTASHRASLRVVSGWPDNLRLRPITTWPGERSRSRTYSPFQSNLSSTLGLLDRELRALRATDVWLEVAMTEGDFRQDGRPRPTPGPSHPASSSRSLADARQGAALRHRPVLEWQDNLRAIALGLEALRKVERYGIANRGEQYAGWAAAPAGGPSRSAARR
jgi:hypothetical protein